MVRADWILRVGLCGLLASVCGLGCGSGPKKAPPRPPDENNLNEIRMAYMLAEKDLHRAPLTKEDLLPYFNPPPDPDNPDQPAKEVNADEVFRAPSDNQEYVIHWGFDMRELDRDPKTWPVMGYQKTSHDGKRAVWVGRYVAQVTDEVFADLPFPEGFKRP